MLKSTSVQVSASVAVTSPKPKTYFQTTESERRRSLEIWIRKEKGTSTNLAYGKPTREEHLCLNADVVEDKA